jgi:hypothetical protein
LLKPAQGGLVAVGENYQQYWFDNFEDFQQKLKIY